MNLSENETGYDYDYPPFPPNWTHLNVVVDVLCLLIGVVGNVSLIYISLRYKGMRTVPNYLITNLAVADLGLIMMFIPIGMVETLAYIPSKYHIFKTEESCSFFLYFRIVLLGASIFTLTALSIDRYLAVSRPLAFRRFRSGRLRLHSILFGISLIWLSSFVVAIPAYLSTALYFSGRCVFTLEQSKLMNWIHVVFFLIIPTVIITLSYCSTATNLVATNAVLQGQNAAVSPRQRRQRLRLAVAIIIIVVVFNIAWCTHYCLEFLRIYELVFFTNSALIYAKRVSRILIRINSTINPVILFILSTAHRQYLKKACCCCLNVQTNDDRIAGRCVTKNASLTMHTVTDESRFRKSQMDHSRAAIITDHQV